MISVFFRTLAAAGLMLAAMPASAADSAAQRGEAALAKRLEGRIAGKPVSCLRLSDARSSQIFDRTAIIYESGGRLYVNRPTDASSLDDDDILVTRVFGGQLCRSDSINLISRGGGFMHGFVILNDFVPYSKPKPAPKG